MTQMRWRNCALLLSTFFLFGIQALADPPARVGRLNYESGTISFRPAGLEEWTDATINYPLTIGDELWVDDVARAEIHVGSAAVRTQTSTS